MSIVPLRPNYGEEIQGGNFLKHDQQCEMQREVKEYEDGVEGVKRGSEEEAIVILVRAVSIKCKDWNPENRG